MASFLRVFSLSRESVVQNVRVVAGVAESRCVIAQALNKKQGCDRDDADNFVCASVKGVNLGGSEGRVGSVQIRLMDSRTFIFDVLTTPELLVQGEMSTPRLQFKPKRRRHLFQDISRTCWSLRTSSR